MEALGHPEEGRGAVTASWVITGEEAPAAWEDGGVAFQEGILRCVGPASHVEAWARAHRVPLTRYPRRILLPGWVNVHAHSMLTYARSRAADMGFAPAYTRGVPDPEHLSPGEAEVFATLGVVEAVLAGTTTLADQYVAAHHVPRAAARAGIRAVVSERLRDLAFGGGTDGTAGDPELRERGLEQALALYRDWHGAAEGRIRVQLGPHAPDTVSDALWHAVREYAGKLGLAVTTHLSQSPLEQEAVLRRHGTTPTRFLDRMGVLSPRFTGAHGLYLSPEDMDLLRERGAAVCHLPLANARKGAVAPLAELQRRRVPLALGTDGMSADMFETVRFALYIRRLAVGPSWEESEPFVPLRQATREGARALGLGEVTGSLSVGKAADFVLLDARSPHLSPVLNPAASVVHHATARDVEEVWVTGRRIYARGGEGPGGFSVEILVQEAQKAAASVWRRWQQRGGDSPPHPSSP